MQALSWGDGWLFRRVFSRQNPQLRRHELDRFVREFAGNATARQTTLREFRQITKPDFFEGYDYMLQHIAESVPTVTVWGEGDPYISDHCAPQLRAQTTIVLPGVGHWVPLVAADALAQHIRLLCGAS